MQYTSPIDIKLNFIKKNLLNTFAQIRKWVTDNPIKSIIIVGTLVRLVVAFLYQYITLYPDSEGYVELAKRILIFDFSGYEGQRSPGYPILLALSNISYSTTGALQFIIGIVTLIYFYKTCLSVRLSKKISFYLTIILSCYLPTIFFEVTILTETLTLLVIILIFYLFFRIRSDQSGQYIGLSILCGYLVLIKPFYIFLPVILFFILLNVSSFKSLLTKLSFIIIIPLFVFLGWSYVNKKNTGYFTSTTFYGFNLAQNCVNFAEKTTPEYATIGNIYAKYRDNRISDKEIAMTIWEAYSELESETGLSFPDLSKRLYDYSMATIKKNPTAYLQQVFISWRDFWKTSLYWEYDKFAIPHANEILLYICYLERILLQLIKVAFIILIPYNIFRGIKQKKITPQLTISIIVFTASILQAFVTYGTNPRFSFPFEMLIVLSVILNVLDIRYKKLERSDIQFESE